MVSVETVRWGWVQGGVEFRQAVYADHKKDGYFELFETKAEEFREPLWVRGLKQSREVLEISKAERMSAREGNDWQVALARQLIERCLTPNRWLATLPNRGTPKSVSSQVGSHRSSRDGRGS